jgi:hypothetical protein
MEAGNHKTELENSRFRVIQSITMAMNITHVSNQPYVDFEKKYFDVRAITVSVVQWSDLLASDPDVPGSIPGTTRFSEK